MGYTIGRISANGWKNIFECGMRSVERGVKDSEFRTPNSELEPGGFYESMHSYGQ